MKILLTGFDPFGGESVNPAWEAVKLVKAPAGAELVRLEVPTVFTLSIQTVMESVRLHRPDAVVCVGQAAGRSEITPERVAINIADASIPDNEGNQPCDEPIVPGGETACFSTLPVKAMVEAIRARGIPAEVSLSAGTFVCNHLLYSLCPAYRSCQLCNQILFDFSRVSMWFCIYVLINRAFRCMELCSIDSCFQFYFSRFHEW